MTGVGKTVEPTELVFVSFVYASNNACTEGIISDLSCNCCCNSYERANFEYEGLGSQSIGLHPCHRTVSTETFSSPGPPSKSPQAVEEPKIDPRGPPAGPRSNGRMSGRVGRAGPAGGGEGGAGAAVAVAASVIGSG